MKIIDVYGILAQSCGAMGVGGMKSTIWHLVAGRGCFAREQFGKQMLI